MRYSRPRTTAPTCTAKWNFPQGTGPGVYSVYVHIPAVRATSEGAIYTIRHAGENDQVVVDQEVFPNIYYVTDGWVYAGKYNFTGAGDEYIELTNRTQDESATIADLFVGADAVRFVLQGVSPVTPTPTSTPTVTATPSTDATSYIHTFAHPNSNCYAYPDSESNTHNYTYSDCYGYTLANAHANRDIYTIPYAYADSYDYAFANPYSNSYTYDHPHSHCDTDAATDSHSILYTDQRLFVNATP
jgi:hypothetical protein